MFQRTKYVNSSFEIIDESPDNLYVGTHSYNKNKKNLFKKLNFEKLGCEDRFFYTNVQIFIFIIRK